MTSKLNSVASITHDPMAPWPPSATIHKCSVHLSLLPLLKLFPYGPLISGSAKRYPLIKMNVANLLQRVLVQLQRQRELWQREVQGDALGARRARGGGGVREPAGDPQRGRLRLWHVHLLRHQLGLRAPHLQVRLSQGMVIGNVAKKCVLGWVKSRVDNGYGLTGYGGYEIVTS